VTKWWPSQVQVIILAGLVLALGCHRHEHDGGHDDGHGHGASEDERPALSFTHWTDASELFIELPALVVGQDSPCAAHVTALASFAALAEGRVSVVLRGGTTEERFEVPAPTVPGIFRPVARPLAAGKRRLVVEVSGPTLQAVHDLGEVEVFATVAEAKRAIPEEAEAPGRIPFLKEQQWPIEFATAVVGERSFRPTLKATGTLLPTAEGEVLVTAPFAGRLGAGARPFPRLGDVVARDALLGLLSPRLDAADLASLEHDLTRASLELRVADREHARAVGLRAEGAVPERRVEDATHAKEEAALAVTAAQRRLAQFRRVLETGDRRDGGAELRAPLTGSVTEVLVAPGSFVEEGAPLVRLTDLSRLWLEVRVPEVDLARVGTLRGASFRAGGVDEAVELSAKDLVARGGRIDPRTHTLSFVFAVDNEGPRLPVGAFAEVLLVNGDERVALAVPETALVDDAGNSVVFVQVEGEAFERRVVRLGARDRGFVEVLTGVAGGEHVVTRGAWSVKLAASSGAVPAHGHAH
jgi:RND family efflux transporter MFP subunit